MQGEHKIIDIPHFFSQVMRALMLNIMIFWPVFLRRQRRYCILALVAERIILLTSFMLT